MRERRKSQSSCSLAVKIRKFSRVRRVEALQRRCMQDPAVILHPNGNLPVARSSLSDRRASRCVDRRDDGQRLTGTRPRMSSKAKRGDERKGRRVPSGTCSLCANSTELPSQSAGELRVAPFACVLHEMRAHRAQVYCIMKQRN